MSDKERKSYAWRLTMPMGGDNPVLDAGDASEDLDSIVFRAIVGETLISYGRDMLSTVIVEGWNNLAEAYADPGVDDNDENVVFE